MMKIRRSVYELVRYIAIDRNKLLERCLNQGKNKIVIEKIRSGQAQLQEDIFIKRANENYGN